MTSQAKVVESQELQNNAEEALSGKEIQTSYDKITLIPVLVGESESGLKTFVCEEKQAGKEIII